MLTEKFVGYTVRKKNNDYLRFDPDTSYELPERQNTEIPLMLYVHIPFCLLTLKVCDKMYLYVNLEAIHIESRENKCSIKI